MKIKHLKEIVMFLVFTIVATAFLTYPFKYTGMAGACPEGQVAEADGTCVETVKEEFVDGVLIIDKKRFFRHETTEGKEEYLPMNKIRANEQGALIVTVKNEGNIAMKKSEVIAKIKGKAPFSINTGTLGPGESRQARIPLGRLQAGKYRMEIIFGSGQREPKLQDNSKEVLLEVYDPFAAEKETKEEQIADAGITFIGLEQNGKKVNTNQVQVKIPVTFLFKVKNTGEVPYKARVKVYLDVSEMKFTDLGMIDPGKEKIGELELIHSLREPKQYAFNLRLDRYFNEKNLGDNRVQVPITMIKTEALAPTPIPVQPTPEPQQKEKIIDLAVTAKIGNLVFLTKKGKYADINNIPENEPFFVIFDTANLGTEKAQAKYVVQIGETIIEKPISGMLGGGGRKEIKQPFSGLKAGTYNLAVGIIAIEKEENLKNNIKEFTLKVIPSKKCAEGYTMEADGTCVEIKLEAPKPIPVTPAPEPTPVSAPTIEKEIDAAFDRIDLYYYEEENQLISPTDIKTTKNVKATLWARNLGTEIIRPNYEIKVKKPDGTVVQREEGQFLRIKPGTNQDTTFKLLYLTTGKYNLEVEIKPSEGEKNLKNNKKIIPLTVYDEKQNLFLARDSTAIFDDAEVKKRNKNFISVNIHLVNQGHSPIRPNVKIYYGSQWTTIPTEIFKNDYWARTEIKIDRNSFPRYIIAQLEFDDGSINDNILKIPVIIKKDGNKYQI